MDFIRILAASLVAVTFAFVFFERMPVAAEEANVSQVETTYTFDGKVESINWAGSKITVKRYRAMGLYVDHIELRVPPSVEVRHNADAGWFTDIKPQDNVRVTCKDGADGSLELLRVTILSRR